MSKVTASIVVNFDSSQGGILTAEIDARPGGYNAGRTSFGANDEPVVLVFASSDVVVQPVESSAGTPEFIANGVERIEQELQFADVAEASISKPFYNGFTYKWIGNNLGAPTIRENRVTIAAAGIGVLKIGYNALFAAWRIADVPSPLSGETTFTVLAVVTGEKA